MCVVQAFINQIGREAARDVYRSSSKKLKTLVANSTEAFTNQGILNEIKNFAKKYKGEKKYEDVLAVSDKNLITANGIAPIEFAREVFKSVALYDEKAIEKWHQLFRNGIWTE